MFKLNKKYNFNPEKYDKYHKDYPRNKELSNKDGIDIGALLGKEFTLKVWHFLAIIIVYTIFISYFFG